MREHRACVSSILTSGMKHLPTTEQPTRQWVLGQDPLALAPPPVDSPPAVRQWGLVQCVLDGSSQGCHPRNPAMEKAGEDEKKRPNLI